MQELKIGFVTTGMEKFDEILEAPDVKGEEDTGPPAYFDDLVAYLSKYGKVVYGGYVGGIGTASDANALYKREDIDVLVFQKVAQAVYDAVSCGFCAPEGATGAYRLACDDAGIATPRYSFIFIEHPKHMLRIRHHIGCRDVDVGTYHFKSFADITPT